eukprot:1184662-Prorocentrum_minimum.AAC.8
MPLLRHSGFGVGRDSDIKALLSRPTKGEFISPQIFTETEKASSLRVNAVRGGSECRGGGGAPWPA